MARYSPKRRTGLFSNKSDHTRALVRERARLQTISNAVLAFEQSQPREGGVIGLTRSLARELARHPITVNTIPPSLVDTPLARRGEQSGEVSPLEVLAQMIPISRPDTPEDIANACVFLCSDGASYITGQQINVNGGSWM